MVENIESLMIAIQTLYPGTISEKQLPMLTERYRAALASLHGIQLDEAWNKVGMTWKKRTAPTPADILAVSSAGRGGSPGTRSVDQFRATMQERDRIRAEDRSKLIADYRDGHEYGYAMARAEGWIGYLEEQVKRSANMIAQRNELRRLPANDARSKVADWTVETCDIVLTPDSIRVAIEKVEKFVPWFSIVTVGGIDRIEIGSRTIDVWRAEAAIPGPPVKGIKQTGLQRVGTTATEMVVLDEEVRA